MSKSNRKRLDEIMREQNLNATQIANMLHCSAVMVRQWRAGLFPMPTHRMELLELKLAARQRGPAA